MKINFDKMYRDSFKIQVSVINKKVGNIQLAEDIVQESYIKAIKYESSYDPTMSKINTWFNKIMFNTLRNHTKGVRLDSLDCDTEGVPLSETLPEELSYTKIQENLNLIRHEISMMRSAKSRDMLRLYYIKGYHTGEIAESMSIKQSSVTSCCHRFRVKLNDKYGISVG